MDQIEAVAFYPVGSNAPDSVRIGISHVAFRRRYADTMQANSVFLQRFASKKNTISMQIRGIYCALQI